MALTPEDVSNKRFTTVRLREGYDMTEVDQFLDEVEAELRRLHGENEDLHAKLRAAGIQPASHTAPAPRAAEETGEHSGAETGAETGGETGAETGGEQSADGARTVVAGADGTGTTTSVET